MGLYISISTALAINFFIVAGGDLTIYLTLIYVNDS